jgi:ABC-2 type transport system permease protein
LGTPENAATNTQYVVVSTALWSLALQGIGWEVIREAMRGTLEQLYMSLVGAWRILLARMIGRVLVNLIIVLMLLSMVTAQQWLNFDLLTLAPVLLLTVVGMLGVGFMVAGLSLIFKQVEAFLQIAQFIFLALVAVPLSAAPWLELAPVVKGADMVRAVMVEEVALREFAALDWASLSLSAVGYFVLGALPYGPAERRAMNRGLLGSVSPHQRS